MTSPKLEALVTDLVALLGDKGVSTDLDTRERLSVDGCKLSPIISSKLPLGLADVVAFPTSAAEIAAVVDLAVTHGVGITPRGKGTGNYGQGIPMEGGLVLDTTRARAILEVGEGFMTAEAGAVMAMMENQAWAAGQQLLMYPSTAQSTVGGFLSGGSGGTGSIEHGVIAGGPFVIALDVVHADGGGIVHVEGEAAQEYLHNYGTAGIIVRATVALEPLQPWRAFYAGFEDFHACLEALREISNTVAPPPRLVSADLPTLADALPANPGIVKGLSSLRAIIDEAGIEQASAIVTKWGGAVVDVREGAQEIMKLSMISYNHAIEWLQRSHPGVYFHVEVGGDNLVDRLDEVHTVYKGAMLHCEGQKGRPIGMLAGEYIDEQDMLDGLERLAAIGVATHNPHQWFVDVRVEETRALKTATDPTGLLNPGKLPVAVVGETRNPLMTGDAA